MRQIANSTGIKFDEEVLQVSQRDVMEDPANSDAVDGDQNDGIQGDDKDVDQEKITREEWVDCALEALGDIDVEAIPETVLLNKIARAKYHNEIDDDVISTEAVERVTDGGVQQIQEKLGLMDDADRDSEGYNDQADPELEKLSLSEGILKER